MVGFIAAGFWLQSIPGYRISSVVNPQPLPDPASKTVVRAGAWMNNYGYASRCLAAAGAGIVGALVAVVFMRARRTLPAFVAAGQISAPRASMFPAHYALPDATSPPASVGQRSSHPHPIMFKYADSLAHHRLLHGLAYRDARQGHRADPRQRASWPIDKV